jgi:hypothetical protein
MTRIRCRDRGCVFNKNGVCSAEEIEYEPDAGCLTMEPRADSDEEDEDWDEEDEELEEASLDEEEELEEDEDWEEEDDGESDPSLGMKRRRR